MEGEKHRTISVKSVKSVDFTFLSTNDTNCTKFFFLSPDEPDEPDGWRNDYLVGLVYLVINSKKGRRYHNGCPSKTTKKKDYYSVSSVHHQYSILHGYENFEWFVFPFKVFIVVFV